jgi:hypothetical protein
MARSEVVCPYEQQDYQAIATPRNGPYGQPMKASSVVASALLAVLLIVAGSWALNSTALGLSIKCRVFNDLGACFVAALSEPYAPPIGRGPDAPTEPEATETPEERAAREAAAEQERRDEAVREASSALGQAIDRLTTHAEDLTNGATDMASSVDDVRSAVAEMHASYDDFVAETKVRPMDDYERGSVCAQLGGVQAALGGVEASQGGFQAASSPYESAVSNRADDVAAVESAVTDLNAAEAADPDGIITGGSTAPYTAEDGQAALSQAAQTARAAAGKAAKATSDLATLVKAADSLMSKANALGGSVAGC